MRDIAARYIPPFEPSQKGYLMNRFINLILLFIPFSITPMLQRTAQRLGPTLQRRTAAAIPRSRSFSQGRPLYFFKKSQPTTPTLSAEPPCEKNSGFNLKRAVNSITTTVMNVGKPEAERVANEFNQLQRIAEKNPQEASTALAQFLKANPDYKNKSIPNQERREIKPQQYQTEIFRDTNVTLLKFIILHPEAFQKEDIQRFLKLGLDPNFNATVARPWIAHISASGSEGYVPSYLNASPLWLSILRGNLHALEVLSQDPRTDTQALFNPDDNIRPSDYYKDILLNPNAETPIDYLKRLIKFIKEEKAFSESTAHRGPVEVSIPNGGDVYQEVKKVRAHHMARKDSLSLLLPIYEKMLSFLDKKRNETTSFQDVNNIYELAKLIDNAPNGYAKLGLTPQADNNSIQKAFKLLIQKVHPDKTVSACQEEREIANRLSVELGKIRNDLLPQ